MGTHVSGLVDSSLLLPVSFFSLARVGSQVTGRPPIAIAMGPQPPQIHHIRAPLVVGNRFFTFEALVAHATIWMGEAVQDAGG